MDSLSTKAIKKIQKAIEGGLSKKAFRMERGVIKSLPAIYVAKIVRIILRDLFPKVTFRVRSESNNVNIYFFKQEAGYKEVKEAVEWFCCKNIDDKTGYV